MRQTPSPDAIKPVIREFLEREVDVWVADGGDGALHWMLRSALEVLEEERYARCAIPLALPTNGGTIDFVAKNVGIKGNAEALLRTLRHDAERARPLDEIEVEAMEIDGLRRTPAGDVPFSTIGFAVAVGGVGQRFFAKYYEADDPRPAQIVRVVARVVSTFPLADTPLAQLLPPHLRSYAQEVFKPTPARVTVDGRVFPRTDMTAIHVASMSLDLGGVFKFFGQANVPGQLHAIYGALPPLQIIRNLPRMVLGRPMVAEDLVDGPCTEMLVEAVGDELLAPVIDGEYYEDVVRVRFRPGRRFRIPRIIGSN